MRCFVASFPPPSISPRSFVWESGWKNRKTLIIIFRLSPFITLPADRSFERTGDFSIVAESSTERTLKIKGKREKMVPGLVAAAAASPLPPPSVTGWTKVPSFNVHDGSAVDVDADVDIDVDGDVHIDVDGGGSKGDHDDDEMALEATTVPVPSKSARVSVSDDGCTDDDDEGEGCCGIGEGGEGGCRETSSRWKCRVLEGIADGTCETLTLDTSESDPKYHGEVSHLLNSNSSVRHLQLRDYDGEDDPFCLFDADEDKGGSNGIND